MDYLTFILLMITRLKYHEGLLAEFKNTRNLSTVVCKRILKVSQPISFSSEQFYDKFMNAIVSVVWLI